MELVDNLSCMSRSISQRLLVILLLVCKLVTVEFMSVSMAEAAMSQQDASSSAQGAPCPDHTQALSPKSAAAASDRVDHPSHFGLCKFGCKCPCAHTPASAMAIAFVQPVVSAHYVPNLYVAPAPGESVPTFFRPPI